MEDEVIAEEVVVVAITTVVTTAATVATVATAANVAATEQLLGRSLVRHTEPAVGITAAAKIAMQAVGRSVRRRPTSRQTGSSPRQPASFSCL